MYRIEIIELVADISDLEYPFFVSQEHVARALAQPHSMMKQGGTTTTIVPGKSCKNFYQGLLDYRNLWKGDRT